MYFWTNTYEQIQFILFAKQVNELAAFIINPNITEEEAAAYRADLATAKDNLANTFQQIQGSFIAWLRNQYLAYPWMDDAGNFHFEYMLDTYAYVFLMRNQSTVTLTGTTIFWEDIYRMFLLNAFLGRAAPPAGEEKYHPREMYNEAH